MHCFLAEPATVLVPAIVDANPVVLADVLCIASRTGNATVFINRFFSCANVLLDGIPSPDSRGNESVFFAGQRFVYAYEVLKRVDAPLAGVVFEKFSSACSTYSAAPGGEPTPKSDFYSKFFQMLSSFTIFVVRPSIAEALRAPDASTRIFAIKAAGAFASDDLVERLFSIARAERQGWTLIPPSIEEQMEAVKALNAVGTSRTASFILSLHHFAERYRRIAVTPGGRERWTVVYQAICALPNCGPGEGERFRLAAVRAFPARGDGMPLGRRPPTKR